MMRLSDARRGAPTSAGSPARNRGHYTTWVIGQTDPNSRTLESVSTAARVIVLYALMYAAFGVSSPFMPAFFEGRGLGPEQLGILLATGTAIRLISGPLCGRVADLTQDSWRAWAGPASWRSRLAPAHCAGWPWR